MAKIAGYTLNSGIQTLPISAHEMALMRAFSILQNGSNDLLALKIVLTEPQRNTTQNTFLITKNSVFSSNSSEKTVLAVAYMKFKTHT